MKRKAAVKKNAPKRAKPGVIPAAAAKAARVQKTKAKARKPIRLDEATPLAAPIAAAIALALHDEATLAERATQLEQTASGWTALARQRGVRPR